MTTDVSEVAPFLGSLQIHVESFLYHLHATGYAPQSVAKIRSIASAFARWSQGEQIAVEDRSEEHLTAFAKRRPPRQNALAKGCCKTPF